MYQQPTNLNLHRTTLHNQLLYLGEPITSINKPETLHSITAKSIIFNTWQRPNYFPKNFLLNFLPNISFNVPKSFPNRLTFYDLLRNLSKPLPPNIKNQNLFSTFNSFPNTYGDLQIQLLRLVSKK